MTEIQILDLQLVPGDYYWCKIKSRVLHIILQYYEDEEYRWVEFYQCASEVEIELKEIESINTKSIKE